MRYFRAGASNYIGRESNYYGHNGLRIISPFLGFWTIRTKQSENAGGVDNAVSDHIIK